MCLAVEQQQVGVIAAPGARSAHTPSAVGRRQQPVTRPPAAAALVPSPLMDSFTLRSLLQLQAAARCRPQPHLKPVQAHVSRSPGRGSRELREWCNSSSARGRRSATVGAALTARPRSRCGHSTLAKKKGGQAADRRPPTARSASRWRKPERQVRHSRAVLAEACAMHERRSLGCPGSTRPAARCSSRAQQPRCRQARSAAAVSCGAVH